MPSLDLKQEQLEKIPFLCSCAWLGQMASSPGMWVRLSLEMQHRAPPFDGVRQLNWLSPSLSCFQAMLFYVPRWLWKNWEAGKVAALRMDLNLGIISEVEKKLKKKLLIEYMYSNLKHHNFWAYRYFFCELLALINVGGKYINRHFGQKSIYVVLYSLLENLTIGVTPYLR